MQFKIKVTYKRDEFVKGVNSFTVDIPGFFTSFMEDFNDSTVPFCTFRLEDNTKVVVNKSFIKSLEVLED